jgi:tetratricopeptide (TPR) repeat protein
METAEAQERSAYSLRNAGDTEGALGAYQRAADAYAREGDTLGEAHAVRHVGDILRGLQRYREADRRYERALALYEAREDRLDLDLANALRGYALSLEAQGKEATAFWQRAHTLYQAAGVEAGVAENRSRPTRY